MLNPRCPECGCNVSGEIRQSMQTGLYRLVLGCEACQWWAQAELEQ